MLKRILQSLLTVMTLFVAGSIQAQTPAFPGAEGFGRYTTGGRGGTVYHVTTLEDTGTQGSLRWACNQEGTRTIVFDVSGTIHLKSELRLRHENVTIAGQTAPGDGICIADYPFVISTDNVIIRFIRFRLGNKEVANHEGDGLGGMDLENIIIDHCSVSWSIDECLSVYGSKNLTVQWCIASQSLREAGHSKGRHGYGGNWGGSGASYHHNLIAHHDSRTPRLGPRPSTQTDERMDMRNNIIYNWHGEGCYGGEAMNVNIVNNYYKPGPATDGTTKQQRIAKIGIRTTDYCTEDDGSWNEWQPTWHKWGTFYVNGNVNPAQPNVTQDNWTYGIYNQFDDNSKLDNMLTDEAKEEMRLDAPITFTNVTTHSAEDAYERVLEYAGASLRRDWVDELIVNDTRNGQATCTGTKSNIPGIIDSQDDLKQAFTDAGDDWSAWPELESEPAPTDTDQDGMPDEWEDANGLDKNNRADGATIGADGYSNLEKYMNSLVQDIMDGGNEGGTMLSGNEEYDGEGGGDEPSQSVVYVLDNTTYTTSSADGYTWNFNNGFSVSNEAGKAYGKESGTDLVKYSAEQFTINIPEGKKVTKVSFYGYNKYADKDSYIAELNGLEYGETDYVFPAKDNDQAVYRTHDIELATPAEGSMTFTIKGKQCALKISLYTDISTGISDITVERKPTGKIYNLQGMEVKEPLRPGIYIRDGKKFIKR